MNDTLPKTEAEWEKFFLSRGVASHTAVFLSKTVIDAPQAPANCPFVKEFGMYHYCSIHS